MPRKSAIEQLPEAVQEQVHRLIREGRTVDEITAKLDELNQDVSRSSVGRYKQRYEKQLERYREAQNVAGIWVEELGQDQKSDVGRLLAEMLKTIAFRTMADMGEDEGNPSPMDLHFLARTIKDLEQSGKISADRIFKVRQEIAKEEREKAADQAVEAVKASGMSGESAEAIRASILGVQPS